MLAGVSYIRGYIFDCLFAGVQFSFSGYFCAYGKSGLSFLHNTLSILLVLLPIVLTFLYSFFPPTEIAAYLKTRNNYSADQFMDLLLSLNLSGAGFATSQSCCAV